MTDQLRVWENEFGRAYTDRNVIDWSARLTAFANILQGLPVKLVLEVGCNRGHNLVALADILDPDTDIIGVEPNRYALELARQASSKVGVLHGHAFDIPFKDGYFDLVFTAGVLIHISLADLPLALAEIYRVSRRYILAIEYFAETETVIQYRGYDNLLWKRNFVHCYQSQFPDLALRGNGYLGAEQGFDRSHWWLMEKTTGAGEK